MVFKMPQMFFNPTNIGGLEIVCFKSEAVKFAMDVQSALKVS